MRNNTPTDHDWLHLGATGLLQPLSEDFLYRSPESPRYGCYRCRKQEQRSEPADVCE